MFQSVTAVLFEVVSMHIRRIVDGRSPMFTNMFRNMFVSSLSARDGRCAHVWTSDRSRVGRGGGACQTSSRVICSPEGNVSSLCFQARSSWTSCGEGVGWNRVSRSAGPIIPFAERRLSGRFSSLIRSFLVRHLQRPANTQACGY